MNYGVISSKSNFNIQPKENADGIRKILTQLQGAGLITVARGTGGIEPTKELSDISFYEVYPAIEPLEGEDLFRFHENPNPGAL